MSKVLIDRELLERAVYHLELAYDAYAPIICDLSSVLSAPSGTPAMPIKAYYHEAPNEYGGFNKSVGLEVRKQFNDAPLVLESDAMARIACLEGELAKRDETIARLEADNRSKNGSMKAFGEQIAKLQKAVRNRERLVGLRDARIMGLESQYQRDVWGLNNEGDPIGGEPAGGYANDNARLRAELAAIKAQEPAAWTDGAGAMYSASLMASLNIPTGGLTPLYAAPVSEAKAQGVVQWPEADEIMQMAFEEGHPADDASGYYFELEEFDLFIDRLMSEVARLNAAPVQQVSVPDVSAMARILADRSADACNVNREDNWAIYGQDYIDDVTAMLSAAPAAPAADAGLVEALDYQALFDAIAAATSVYANGAINISVQAFRDALAAHRDQGAAKC